MKSLADIYAKFVSAVSALQSPFLLAVRLYWGYQLMQTGLGKLRHLDKITSFFQSLNIPLPGFNAHFVAGLEFFGGILLMIGLGSRIVSLLMCVNMLVAYWTADHEALTSFFSDPGKFYAADPFTFLFVSLIILIFGAGFFSLDKVIATRWMERKAG
ncbi:DoxX family protein [Silvibacterium acidisoli]|uniref:DoxX family protein n=1 Tax=Acidobacteriaceae bacterium ZG23-2 TaxID=2883246 RepID=UPI00406C25BE